MKTPLLLSFISLGIGAMGLALPAYGQTESTYLKWDEVKCSDPASPDCYRELVDHITTRTQNSLQRNALLNPISVHGYSKFTLQKTKPEFVVISIHGLWWSTRQFSETLQNFSDLERDAASNIIELTLPGHIKAEADPAYYQSLEDHRPTAQYQEWLEAVKNTLLIARSLGNKTLIVGHSTGALLATIAAKEHSRFVDGLLLIEPAIRLQNLTSLGVCLSKIIPRKILESVYSLMGRTLYKGMDLSMGCEVHKLASRYFPPRYKNEGMEPYSPADRVQDYSYYTELAKNIRTPVILVNNENDDTVSPEANRSFYKGLSGFKHYVSINQDGSTPHSQFIPRSPEFLAQLLKRLKDHLSREGTL